LLPAGRHVLEVSGHPSELTVRAIPALVYNLYWPNAPGGQRIEPFGRHTWERLSKHMLPNVNTIESVVVDTPEHREWLAQGKHWTPHVQAPGLIDKQKWTVEKMREIWLNPGKTTAWPDRPSFTLDKFTGISVDEYAGNHPSAEIVRMTTTSVADLADHPAYAGKLWVPFFASTRGANTQDRPFLKTVLGNGWPFKEELYLSEMPTEPENLLAIRDAFTKVASKYEAAVAGSMRRMIFVLSYSGLGTMSANRHPEADFRVHLDMQMQALATHPAYFALWGVEPYRSHNADPETVDCMGMLLRHYCVEGKTGRMLGEAYELKHVANPDFTDGLRRMWFDQHVHDDAALTLLTEAVGVDRLVVGTNLAGWDAPSSPEKLREIPAFLVASDEFTTARSILAEIGNENLRDDDEMVAGIAEILCQAANTIGDVDSYAPAVQPRKRRRRSATSTSASSSTAPTGTGPDCRTPEPSASSS
jgi:hypothetical protein